MPTPTSANSDTSPANSDGPLANFGACPAATDTYPGLPKPRKPPPLFLIFIHPSLTQHPASSDLFRNITTTSEQPAIPSTYQCGTIFDHNQHPPTPSSPAKPRRHSRRTPKSSGSQYISHRVALRTPVLILLNVTYGLIASFLCFVFVFVSLSPHSQFPGLISVSRSYLSLPVSSRPLFVIVLVIVSYLRSNLLLFHIVSSDAVPVTSSDPCAQFLINPNDLTNSAIIITNPGTPYQPPTPLLPQISRTAFCLNPAKTVSFPHNPTSPDLPGPVWITSPQLPAQTTRTQNVFECPVTNAGESRPPMTVAEVEQEASNMEVEGKEELEAVPAVAEEDKEEERAEEVEVRQWVGNNELEWLGEDLGWPTPLMSAASLADFDERAVGVEQWFQWKLEAAKEELLAAQAHYTVTKQMLAILVGYQHDCQAFLAWQEENNIREGDWEEAEAMEVPDDDAALNA
ncbi:hypothetical protein J132_03494 [Termitomyces sp. J132]|nr:hypothetical protein J132_03494 [Termitomyces sp. J132]